MAVEGAPQASLGLVRNDPKVVAALVNRFIADSAGFLQDFAQQCEAKLFDLSKRIHRLQRLIELFEHKIELLEPADAATLLPGPAPGESVEVAVRGAPTPAAAQGGVGEVQRTDAVSGPSASPGADAAPLEVEAEAVASAAAPVLDEKYQKYKRMHRAGVPLLAIRQRLLLDAVEDPSLDVSVLDTFDGAAGTGAGMPAPPPKAMLPRPAAADAAAGAARPAAAEEPRVSEAPPEPQAEARTEEPQPAAAQINPSDMTLAEAVAASARRRQSRILAETSADAAPADNGSTADASAGSAPQTAPREPPAPKPKPKLAAKSPEAKGGGLAAAILAKPKLPTAPDPLQPKDGAPAFGAPAKASPPPPPPPKDGAQLFGAPAKAAPPPPPPPGKAKASAAAAKAASPEAAMLLRRSIVQVESDGEQSDVSDF